MGSSAGSEEIQAGAERGGDSHDPGEIPEDRFRRERRPVRGRGVRGWGPSRPGVPRRRAVLRRGRDSLEGPGGHIGRSHHGLAAGRRGKERRSRAAVRGPRFSSLATPPSPLATRNPPPTDPPKSGSLACSIPHWFVLSCNLQTTNSRAIWLRSGTFLSPAAPSLQIHWPPTAGPAGSGNAQTLPRWLLPDTDRRIAKDRMGPIWPSGPSISLLTEPGDSCGKLNPFPLTRRRPPTEHSLAARGARRLVSLELPAGWP